MSKIARKFGRDRTPELIAPVPLSGHSFEELTDLKSAYAFESEQVNALGEAIRLHAMLNRSGKLITPADRALYELTVESIHRRTGLPMLRTVAESMYARTFDASLALEGLGEFIGNIWKKVKEFFMFIWNKILDFFNWIFGKGKSSGHSGSGSNDKPTEHRSDYFEDASLHRYFFWENGKYAEVPAKDAAKMVVSNIHAMIAQLDNIGELRKVVTSMSSEIAKVKPEDFSPLQKATEMFEKYLDKIADGKNPKLRDKIIAASPVKPEDADDVGFTRYMPDKVAYGYVTSTIDHAAFDEGIIDIKSFDNYVLGTGKFTNVYFAKVTDEQKDSGEKAGVKTVPYLKDAELAQVKLAHTKLQEAMDKLADGKDQWETVRDKMFAAIVAIEEKMHQYKLTTADESIFRRRFAREDAILWRYDGDFEKAYSAEYVSSEYPYLPPMSGELVDAYEILAKEYGPDRVDRVLTAVREGDTYKHATIYGYIRKLREYITSPETGSSLDYLNLLIDYHEKYKGDAGPEGNARWIDVFALTEKGYSMPQYLGLTGHANIDYPFIEPILCTMGHIVHGNAREIYNIYQKVSNEISVQMSEGKVPFVATYNVLSKHYGRPPFKIRPSESYGLSAGSRIDVSRAKAKLKSALGSRDPIEPYYLDDFYKDNPSFRPKWAGSEDIVIPETATEAPTSAPTLAPETKPEVMPPENVKDPKEIEREKKLNEDMTSLNSLADFVKKEEAKGFSANTKAARFDNFQTEKNNGCPVIPENYLLKAFIDGGPRTPMAKYRHHLKDIYDEGIEHKHEVNRPLAGSIIKSFNDFVSKIRAIKFSKQTMTLSGALKLARDEKDLFSDGQTYIHRLPDQNIMDIVNYTLMGYAIEAIDDIIAFIRTHEDYFLPDPVKPDEKVVRNENPDPVEVAKEEKVTVANAQQAAAKSIIFFSRFTGQYLTTAVKDAKTCLDRAGHYINKCK